MSLAHIRAMQAIFNPSSSAYLITTKHDNTLTLGKVWATGLEDAIARGSLAGEVVSVSKVEVA